MRVQYFRSTQRSPDDDKWYVSVDLVNYYETPPRKISLLDFLDTGLEKIRIQVDPSPQTYAYYYAL